MLSTALLISVSAGAQDSSQQQTSPLRFNAFVETYYSYDFNKPENNRRPGFLYSYNRHNEFNVNLVFLKESYITERVRANLALAAGSYMSANYAAEPGLLKNIFEANVGYKLSNSKKLWLDMGILPSHLGFETAYSPDCWTLTRSMAADNSPYFESGARLTYSSDNGKWVLSALALNGWQRIQRLEGNSLMSWGTQVQFIPSDKVLLSYSSFLGTDKPDSTRTWRYFHDFYGIFQFTKQVGLTFGFDIGQEQASKNSGRLKTWFTPQGILRYKPVDKWAIALRVEYYSDEKGVLIPVAVSPGSANGFKTAGYSLNIDYLPLSNVQLRLEGRTLHSKDAIFSKDGTATTNNTALTFSTAISF